MTQRVHSLTFVDVTPKLWPRLGAGVQAIEDVSFSPELRETPAYLRDLARSRSSVVIAAMVDEQVVGYVAGDRLEQFRQVPGVASDQHYGRSDTFYLTSVAVEPEHRGLGIGTSLVHECVRRALRDRYARVTAHIESGAEDRIGFGAHVLATYRNWFGTGRPFDYVEFVAMDDAHATMENRLSGNAKR